MELFDAINHRKCIRRYHEAEVAVDIVEKLLAAAIRAPSAGNLQPWHFYAVFDPAVRKRLSEAALSQKHVASAPVVVVVCVDPEVSSARYGRRGRDLYCIQDGAAATQNLLLAAVGMGLGACWVGAFDEREVADAISARSELRPISMVPLGYQAGPFGTSSRLPLGQVVTYIG